MAAALSVAGCGDDKNKGSGGSSNGSAGKSGATVKVSETEYKLNPASPRVSRTGVTSFEATNDGRIEHALEVEGPSGQQKIDSIAPGKSATLKVDLAKPGRYEWYCPIADHKDRGMRGEITVAGGGSKGKSGGDSKKNDSGGGGAGGY